MENLLTALSMAWGNFLSLPCPYKRWDNNLKNAMLACLPTIGMVVGVLWLGLAVGLSLVRLPGILMAALLGFYLHVISGFMHLDGYMDVSDAVMSRRPLEEKRRILKDSRVGAMAVVSVIFLILMNFASLIIVMSYTFTFSGFAPFLLMPVASRAAAGLMVLTMKPMEISQYAEDYERPRGGLRIALILQVAVYAIAVLSISWFWDGMEGYGLIRTGVPALVTLVGTIGACLYGNRQLAGMNGDVAGYAICLGEVLGLVSLAMMY